MEKKLILFELVELANKMGFLDKGETHFAAPILSLLQKWLLKEKHIFVEILYDYEYDSTSFHFNIIDIHRHKSIMKEGWSTDYAEYDEALEHGLAYVFNLLKER